MTEFDRHAQELAKLLLPRGQSRGQPALLMQGVVERVFLGRVSVFLEGDTLFPISGIRYLRGFTPHAGDVVWIIRAGLDMWIVGILETKANAAPIETWRIVGATDQPAFQNSWVWWGNPYGTPGFALKNDGWVMLKGVAKNGSGSTAIIYTLPEGYRPPFNMKFSIISNDVAAVLQIKANGEVNMSAGGSTSYVSLDGITFPTKSFWDKAYGTDLWAYVLMQGGWNESVSDDGKLQVFLRPDGWNWLKGEMSGGTSPGAFMFLPESARLKHGQMVAGTAIGSSQIQLERAGTGFHVTGTNNANTLDGIHWWSDRSYHMQEWVAASFINSWANYDPGSGGNWQDVQYQKDSFGVTHIRGLADGAGKSSNIMFNLPVGYRPLEKKIFHTVKNIAGSTARLDVYPNGDVEGVNAVTDFHSCNVLFKAEQ